MTATKPVWSWALAGARSGQEAAKRGPERACGLRTQALVAAGYALARGMPEAATGAYVEAYMRAFVAWRGRTAESCSLYEHKNDRSA